MIREKIKNLYQTRFGKYIIFPGVLLILWAFLTLLYIITFDTSFSIWSYNHSNSAFTKLTFNPLYKGSEIEGQFVARDNNLGIVSIRFQTFIRPPYSLEDHYIFRIKEKGSKAWYYQNIYRSGLVYDVPFFPFGFPQIANSKGKIYQFQIISLNGNPVNALEISNRRPILVSKYKYSGHELLQNKKELMSFFITKVYNAMQNPDVWFSSLIYLLPFLFYLFWISIFEKYFKPIKIRTTGFLENLGKSPLLYPVFSIVRKIFILNLDMVIIFIVLIDILIIQLTNDVVYLVIIPLWIITLKRYGKESGFSFLIGILILLLAALFLFLKEEPTAEKATVWAYMFLIAGTVQIFLENIKLEKE